MAKIANMGGLQVAQIIQVTPVITAGAYSAGQSVGGTLTLPNVLQARSPNNGGAMLTDLTVVDKSNQKAALSFLFYSMKPTATITDNATFLAATDIANFRGRVDVAQADYVTFGSDSVGIAQEKQLGILLENTEAEAASDSRGIAPNAGLVSQNLYCICVTTGTPTYAATNNLIFTFKFNPVF